MKLNSLKQMHRFIDRDNCSYRKPMDNVDHVTRSLLGPLFMNIFPQSTEVTLRIWVWPVE